MPAVEICDDGTFIKLDTNAGQFRCHAIWLRDNAADEATRASSNGQRLIALRDIPHETRITGAELEGSILRLSFAPENKTVDYDLPGTLEPSRVEGADDVKLELVEERVSA